MSAEDVPPIEFREQVAELLFELERRGLGTVNVSFKMAQDADKERVAEVFESLGLPPDSV